MSLGHIKGHRPIVQVTHRNSAVERKARALLVGRQVVAVEAEGDLLVVKLDDGGELRVLCEGGFREVS